jgi:hypothetical protein
VNVVVTAADSNASPVKTAVRGYEALKAYPNESENSSEKTVSVAQNDKCNKWPSNASIGHEPVVSIEEDRVGSMNHLLG